MTEYLPVLPDHIPETLRRLPWVLWRAEPRPDGKPAKVPYMIRDPWRRASSTNPETWGLFRDAVEVLGLVTPLDPIRGPLAGIGVVLIRSAGVTCIDLDRVIAADGTLDARAETIVDRCHSWTERSPSGTGLHVFVRGTVPEALKGNQIEVYSTDRYICVTGQRWFETPDEVVGAQAYLDGLVKMAREKHPPPVTYTGPSVPPPDDLAGALLSKLTAWRVPHGPVKRWQDGYLVELLACPWASVHTTGIGGAAVIIRASGAYDFTCLHAHCAGRSWRDFRTAMEAHA